MKNNIVELKESELEKLTGGTAADYQNMFEGCSPLETAPELPANTLEQGAHKNMFEQEQGLGQYEFHFYSI